LREEGRGEGGAGTHLSLRVDEHTARGRDELGVVVARERRVLAARRAGGAADRGRHGHDPFVGTDPLFGEV